jgi:hypothetical protein
MKNVIKKIRPLYKLLYFFYYYVIPSVLFFFRQKKRELGLNKCNEYELIKQYKNIHSGERCFIVATGPSLTIEDLEKLKNETTFSMNSIVMALKDTSWSPDYYGIQDPFVYEKIKEEIIKSDIPNKFYGDRLYRMFDLPENSVVFPHNLLNHKIKHNNYNSKFSDDSYLVVYDGYSITYSLIQIAVYMGFKEIYLLGADTNYEKDKQHFREHEVKDASYRQAGIRMIEAYKVAKKYADENGIKIYNATRGGMLEVFPRVDLDEVLGLRENN